MSYTEEMIAEIEREVKPLIAERDAIFDENAKLAAYIIRLEAAAENVLRTYMPQFPDSRAVDDCLVALAVVTAEGSGRLNVCEWSEIEPGSDIYNTCKEGEDFYLNAGMDLWPFCHQCGRRIEVTALQTP